MLKKLLPLGVDEIIAVLLLVAALPFLALPFFQTIQALAAGYLVICVIFRKYEATQLKLRRDTLSKDHK